MARNESKKLLFTLFLISLSLHLLVFAASSHEYAWEKRDQKSQPIKFRVVSVEKLEEKLPPNPQSRFLSNANRKESGSGKPSKTPRLRRENKNQIPSRRGVLRPKVASLAPVPKSKAPAPAALPVRPKPPAVVMLKPDLEKVEKSKERKPLPTPEIKKTPQSIETARLSPAPKPPLEIPSPARREKIKPKEKPKAVEKPRKKKTATKALPENKREPRPVVKKKLQKKNKKVEAKRKTKEKLDMVALPPVLKSKAPTPAVLPVSPKPPAVAMLKPDIKKLEKSKERKPPETLEAKETPKPIETASLTPAPKPSLKVPSPVLREKIKPKAKPKADDKPKKKKAATKVVAKDKRKPRPVVKKKVLKKVIRKKSPKEEKKGQARGIKKEKLKVAALKPVPRLIRPQLPDTRSLQPQDPLALFRVKPQPKEKPNTPKFDLSDEVADKIAKKSLSDKDMAKEEGETISLDTRDFRYASYFAHIKRRIQNAWIWPVEAQKYGGKLLLRFKLRENGTLEEVRLIRSAGIRILDDLAMAAVTKAAPFEPFPVGLERKSITATFVYE